MRTTVAGLAAGLLILASCGGVDVSDGDLAGSDGVVGSTTTTAEVEETLDVDETEGPAAAGGAGALDGAAAGQSSGQLTTTTASVDASTTTGAAGVSTSAPEQPVAPADERVAQLQAAKGVTTPLIRGGHAYITVIEQCPDCLGAEPVQYYVQVNATNPAAATPAGFPGGQDLSGNPSVVSPFAIHDRLIAAIGNGDDVVFELDPRSGVPTLWTINGVGALIVCVAGDTAPPDLKNEGCGEGNIIGVGETINN